MSRAATPQPLPKELYWIRCEKCGRSLDTACDEPMQLATVFKPSLVPTIPKLHPKEERHRCRQCGMINIFVPVSAVPVERDRNSLLTPSWRSVTVKS